MPINNITEEFLSEYEYPIGTIVDFAGYHEVRMTLTDHSARVAGVITSDTENSLNEDLFTTVTNAVSVTMVIAGRAMCKVKGKVGKGDLLVSSDEPGIAQRLSMEKYVPGCVLGKSISNKENDETELIQIIVGTVT